jgi:tetratricopeptide (TPR) repeat protein
LAHSGHCEEAIEEIAKGLRLSPRDSQAFVWFGYKALALYHLRRYEEAGETALYARRVRPHPVNLKPLAASSAQLGHTQDAAAVIAELLALPGGSVEMTRWYLRRYSDGAARDHMIDGLRKAGLTEV